MKKLKYLVLILMILVFFPVWEFSYTHIFEDIWSTGKSNGPLRNS